MDRPTHSIMSIPGVHSLALTGGGELKIVEPLDSDDDYRLVHEKDGTMCTFSLSALDVLGVRQLSGDVVMARAEKGRES